MKTCFYSHLNANFHASVTAIFVRIFMKLTDLIVMSFLHKDTCWDLSASGFTSHKSTHTSQLHIKVLADVNRG